MPVRHLKRILLAIASLLLATCTFSVGTSVSADSGETSESSVADTSSSISMGPHRCLINSSGAVKCWGPGPNGALGNATRNTSTTPVQVSGLTSGWKSVTAFRGSTCAVSTSGAAKCWGANSQGQVGNGTSGNEYTVPTDPTGMSSDVKDISIGYLGTCALMATNSLNCWGHRWSLGNGSTTSASTPQGSPTGLGNNIKIIAAATHNCALTTGGDVWCWGYGGEGQLNTTISESLTPINIALGTTATALALGSYFSCVITTAGGVKCWGRNTAGEMGRGNTTTPATVGDVPGLTSGVRAIAAGQYHACALLADRTVKCWGSNGNGELGNGTTTDTSSPVAVMGLGGEVRTITAGEDGTCAILMNYAVQCWGKYPGNGSTSSTTPVYVTGFSSGGGGGVPVQTSQSPLSISTTTGTYGTALSLSTSGGSGSGAVSYSLDSAGTAGCTLSSGSLSATSSGTCTVTATKADDTYYFSATSGTTTITFSRASQTISWTTDTSHQRTASPITMTAATTSGTGTISYSVVSNTTDSCSVNSGSRSLTFTGIGNCVVRATASTTDQHSSATLDKTFTVIDTVQPTLTLTTTNATSSTTSISFELTGNEPIDCSTVTSSDFLLTNIDQIDSIVQSTTTKCTIAATSSVSPGSSGTSSLRASNSFSVDDRYGNSRTTIATGSPASVSVTIADTTAPVLTLAASNASVTTSSLTFTLTGNEPINCLTLTSIDFTYTNIASIDSISQTSPTRCTILASSSLASGATGISSIRESLQFAVDDAAGNTQTNIATGSPASVSVSIPSTTTTSTTPSSSSSTTPPATAVGSPTTTVQTSVTIVSSNTPLASTNSPNGIAVPTTTTTSTTTTTAPPALTSSETDGTPPLSASAMSKIPKNQSGAVFIDGKLVQATTRVADGAIQITIAGTSSSISASSSDGRVTELSADGRLLLRVGERITARAQGFAAETGIQLWMYSTPTKLGEGVTDQRGAYVTEQVVPDSVSAGDHRLVLTSKNVEGKSITVVFAARVIDKSLIVKVATSPFAWLLLIALVIVALILPSRLRERRS